MLFYLIMKNTGVILLFDLRQVDVIGGLVATVYGWQYLLSERERERERETERQRSREELEGTAPDVLCLCLRAQGDSHWLCGSLDAAFVEAK